MATNNFTTGNQKADITLTDGTNTFGFQYQEKTTLGEARGTSFASSVSSGATTYQDASPFKRQVFDNWIGGLGQTAYNKTFGGTGIGGDDTKYLDADAYTKRTGYLLPGMARNLVYPTTSAAFYSSGLNPLAGDEYEVPLGVEYLDSSTNPSSTFTITGTPTISKVRFLVLFPSPGNAVSLSVYATITKVSNGAVVGNYQTTVSSPLTYTGCKWVTLDLTSGTGVTVSGSDYIIGVGPTANVVICGYPYGPSNLLTPYFQLMTSATPPKYWPSPVVKMEQLLNGTTYVNVALTASTLFNPAIPGTAPRALTGTYRSSLVFNNTLYVFTTAGVLTWSASAAATNAVATQAIDAGISGYSPGYWKGLIYLIGADQLSLYKWDGNFPAAPTVLLSPNLIGQKGVLFNGLFFLGGYIHIIKPEGIFQIFRQPEKIDTTEAPPVNQLVTFPTLHPDTGKYFTILQQMLYCNYRDLVYQVMFNTTTGQQVTITKPDFPRYRLSYFHYVNGITNDGRDIYVSWNNLGAYSLSGLSWHKMFEFYETVAVEGQASALTWLPNPTSAPDYLFCGDGRTLVQMPCPNAYGPYTGQIFANHVNKCGWWESSAWDGDLAEITKYIQSAVLRAVPNGYSYKLVAVIRQPGSGGVSFSTLQESTLASGLARDRWVGATATYNTAVAVVTTLLDIYGVPVGNTLAPTCWVASDFDSVYYSSEKLAVSTNNTATIPYTTDILTNPVKLVQTSFILYFWNTTPGQALTTGQGIMAVDSLSIKHLPIQDYIPSYNVTLDMSSLIDEQVTAETNANVNYAVTQIRAWAGRHSPIQASFYTSEGVKTVNVFIQNPRFEYDPIAQGDGTDPIPKRCFLSLIGIDGEYQGT